MQNIKFINRKKELEFLKNLKGNYFLVITGRRRIGKTRLLRESFKNAYYIFVWPNKSMGWILENISKELGVPRFTTFSDLINYLLEKNKPVILDEFQNFMNIDRGVFGELQKIIDERKMQRKGYKLIVCGSSYSMLNKIFYDYASPIYGRRTEELRLGHLPKEDLLKDLKLKMKDFVELWSVFEGVPYYYEFINPSLSGKENIKRLLIEKNARLQEEGKAVISIEFGSDAKTYNTVLTAIAEGKTRLNEIASLFGNKPTAVIKYLEILRKQFNLVKRLTPVLAGRKSKEGVYHINDNFLRFWFYFIEKNRHLIEQEREKELIEFFDRHFEDFVGKQFEKFCLDLIKEKALFADFNFTKIGRQWGRIPGAPKGKNQYEIDIVALNEKTKEILFAECKWQNKVNPEKIASELIEKTKHVKWHNEDRKENLAIFAKSFTKKIKEYEGIKVHCYDLKDLEKIMKRKNRKI